MAPMPQDGQSLMQRTLELEDLNQSETVESVSNKIFFLERDISDMNAKIKRLQMQIELDDSDVTSMQEC